MKKILEEIGCTNIKKENTRLESYSFFYTSDHLKVKGFITLPKTLNKKNPLIIFNRGGTGEFSKIDSTILNRYDFLVEEGYVLLCSQYRGVDGGEGKDRMGGDDIFDVINLFELFRVIECIDQERIGVYGVSRGGMMTLQLLTRVNWIKTAVLIAPMVDEFKMSQWRDGWRDHQIKTYGGAEVEMYKRSPLRWVEMLPYDIPVLICHGAKDEKVPFDSSKDFFQKWQQFNKKVVFKEVENGDHLISQETKADAIGWFKHIF